MQKENILQNSLSTIITAFPYYMSFFLENNINCINTPKISLKEALEHNSIDSEHFLIALKTIPHTHKLPFSPTISFAEFTNNIYTHYHIPTRALSALILQEITDIFPIENIHSNILELYKIFMIEMEEHLLKEETILFPMIQNYEDTNDLSFKQMLKCPIEKMEAEHQHHQGNLNALIKESLRINNSSEKTQALHKNIEKLFLLTMEHVHIENNILFERIRAS